MHSDKDIPREDPAQTPASTTDTSNPDYYHKVVDCQWACPAHTPVPEYIRLIAEGRYTDAYMINWHSNVFPGILGRTCDRPCEPACRRGRVEKAPVAICRLKRVAADHKDEITSRLPRIPKTGNGRRIALIGAGPASLTVARDLLPLGYSVTIFERDHKAGGMMRTQIPKFRLPEAVLDEECGYILDMGPELRFDTEVMSLKDLLDKGFDAVFVGSGAPHGRDLKIPGRAECSDHIHLGIEWLASVAFGHTTRAAKRVVVIGDGNTAMDCCRTARRLGGEDVSVVIRTGEEQMKASPWEKEDAQEEGVPILPHRNSIAFMHKGGTLTGVKVQKVMNHYDADGTLTFHTTGEDSEVIPCDEVLIAIGQENGFPFIERDIGLEFNKLGMPVVDKVTFQSTLPQVFFGGDAAFGPRNIITAVAHGHEAALSIDLYCRGESLVDRPPPYVTRSSQKMGIHEWAYDNDISLKDRFAVPKAAQEDALAHLDHEVELGYDEALAFKEAERCLNCDIQTAFSAPLCIECDACVDICPMDCITFTHPMPEEMLRTKLKAPATNLSQDIFVSEPLGDARILVKDEDVCLHCGLCAERCPTGAWDMQKFFLETAKAIPCRG